MAKITITVEDIAKDDHVEISVHADPSAPNAGETTPASLIAKHVVDMLNELIVVKQVVPPSKDH